MSNSAPITSVNSDKYTPVSVDGQEASQALAHDYSPWGMFINADIVVQAVIISLILCSIFCWAIIFEKWGKFKVLNFKARKFEKAFWSGNNLDKLYEVQKNKANHPLAFVFVAAMDELNKSDLNKAKAKSSLRVGIKQRISKSMNVTKNRAIEEIESRLGFLATVGSTAPFIGLFGTVWGIMNSFTSIAAAKNTTLAVVAPGIAEALFATAIGLVAAIPAVIAYNKFSSSTDKYINRLEDFSDEFDTLISRQLDEEEAS